MESLNTCIIFNCQPLHAHHPFTLFPNQLKYMYDQAICVSFQGEQLPLDQTDLGFDTGGNFTPFSALSSFLCHIKSYKVKAFWGIVTCVTIIYHYYFVRKLIFFSYLNRLYHK